MARGSKRVAASEEEEDHETQQRHASGSRSKRQRSTSGNAEDQGNPRGKRLSAAHGSNEEMELDSSEVDESMVGAEDANSAREGEEVDDLEDDDDDDDTEDDVRGQGSFAAMGLIEKISLTNFMCHDRLVIDLGPRLNFVIGHNGSGKSAILTGITIALGAKASQTSRATSVKSFVKEGRDVASIEVTIKNSGEDAFEPSKYGDKIIIERIIRKDGSSNWKIKSKRDKLVSSSREDLDAILDHGNIQIDNPLNVLTQDSARQFLSSSSPKDLYNFFLRGTQLSQLSAEYDLVSANITRIIAHIKQKVEGRVGLKTNLEEANARHSLLNRALQQRALLDTMNAELVWAQVEAKEEEFGTAVISVKRCEKAVQQCRVKMEASEEEAKQCDEEIKRADQAISAANETSEPMRERWQQLRTAIKEHAAKMRNTREEQTTINNQFQRIGAQLVEIDKSIKAEMMKSGEGGWDARKAEYEGRRRQLQLEAEKLKKDEIETQHRIDEIDDALRSCAEQEKNLMRSRDALRRNVEELDSNIVRLRSARSNHIAAYGPRMPDLLKLVQAERRWQDAVIGPLGAKIKLVEAKWAPVLESVIGNTLNAFCVTNHHDRALLTELKRRANCDEVPILTGSRENFNFSHGEPGEEIKTILRVLRIDDEFIKRQLVNALSIEKGALVDNRGDGVSLMRSRPNNVRVAYSLDMFRLQHGDAGGSTQVLQPHHGPPRLSADVEQRLQDALRRQPEVQGEVTKADSEIERLRNEIVQLQEERRDLRRRLPEIERGVRQKQGQMETIDDQLREDEPANTAALIEGRSDLENERKTLQAKFKELDDALAAEDKNIGPMVKERDEINAKLRERTTDHEAFKERLGKAAKDRAEAVNNRTHWETRLATSVEKLSDANKRMEIIKQTLATFTKDAEEYHARVEVKHSVEEYQRRVAQLEAERRQADRRQGLDLETIQREVEDAYNAYEKAENDITALKMARKMLTNSLEIRLAKWYYFRRRIAMRTKQRFSNYLSTRAFEGSLTFDHNNKRLMPRIKTDANTSNDMQFEKDPSSLSGGEKSFSTICLLLSLWEAIGCPIRCLDEFDVFMDAVTRRYSMRLMMDAAKINMDTQYILITPQNITNIASTQDCRIHRLADPERNQTTLT